MDSHETTETTEKLFGRSRSRRYRGWLRFGTYLAIIAAFVFLLAFHQLDRLEHIVLDTFMKFAHSTQFSPDIVLIEISETALDEIGPWPWPRSYHAAMLRLLDEWKAAAIVLDFNFSEPTDPKEDRDLSQVFARITAPVYLPVDLKPQKERKFWIHGMPVVLDQGEGKMTWVHALPKIKDRAQAIGHRELSADPDGILRRFNPFLSYGTETYPFFVLPAAYDFLKKRIPLPKDWTAWGDHQGKVIIPWAGGWGERIARYSSSDLIHSFYAVRDGLKPVIDPKKIAGKICMVGLVAKNQAEFKTTPFDVSYPALGVYADIMNAALTGNWIRPAPFWLNILCLIGIGLLASILFILLRGALSLLSGLLLGIGWFLFCFLIFYKAHYWFYGVYPLLLILGLFVFSAIYVQITAAREKTHLFHLATRDGLTGLYVIRHFRVIMNQIVREASVHKEPLSIILFDIDNFKKINDTYGHPAGDMVLKKTASVLLSHIRKQRPFREIDFAARYGGEEFIIMLRKASLTEAAQCTAERLRSEIEKMKFEWEGKNIPVTISLGVATLHSGENVPDPMVHRVDEALYKAKRAGKNRVCTEND